ELLQTAPLTDVPEEDTEAGTQVKEENNRLRATWLILGPANNMEKPAKRKQHCQEMKPEDNDSSDNKHGAEGAAQQNKTDQEVRAYHEMAQLVGIVFPGPL
ncbi:hypothetical protein DUNSADRAFT_8484, partial [Dunaliella salina]